MQFKFCGPMLLRLYCQGHIEPCITLKCTFFTVNWLYMKGTNMHDPLKIITFNFKLVYLVTLICDTSTIESSLMKPLLGSITSWQGEGGIYLLQIKKNWCTFHFMNELYPQSVDFWVNSWSNTTTCINTLIWSGIYCQLKWTLTF